MEINDAKLLRRKGVADMLGVSRHTVSRIMKKDPTFPRFIQLSCGIEVVRAREIKAWFLGKELEAREKSIKDQHDTK